MSDESLFARCFIAYDGSPSCHKLMTVYHKFHPKLQFTTIVHIYDPLKNYIPTQARASSIHSQMTQKTAQLQKIQIHLVQKYYPSTKTTNQCILQQYLKSKSTFIMLGLVYLSILDFMDLKELKLDPLILLQGQEGLYMIRKLLLLLQEMYMKQIKRQERNVGQVVYCCDGSEISYQGLKKCMDFCQQFGYKCTVLHVFNQDTKVYSKQVKAQLKNIQQQQQQQNSFQFAITIEKGSLIQYLISKINTFDWIIITKNGYRGEITGKVFVGSNTTQILTKVQSNILIF